MEHFHFIFADSHHPMLFVLVAHSAIRLVGTNQLHFKHWNILTCDFIHLTSILYMHKSKVRRINICINQMGSCVCLSFAADTLRKMCAHFKKYLPVIFSWRVLHIQTAVSKHEFSSERKEAEHACVSSVSWFKQAISLVVNTFSGF